MWSYILFFEKNLCTHTGIFFILYLGSSGPHFAGAVALFMLSLLYLGCVLEVNGL